MKKYFINNIEATEEDFYHDLEVAVDQECEKTTFVDYVNSKVYQDHADQDEVEICGRTFKLSSNPSDLSPAESLLKSEPEKYNCALWDFQNEMYDLMKTKFENSTLTNSKIYDTLFSTTEIERCEA